MMKIRSSWMICGYEPVCIGGYWTFMPFFCETKRARKMIAQRKKVR